MRWLIPSLIITTSLALSACGESNKPTPLSCSSDPVKAELNATLQKQLQQELQALTVEQTALSGLINLAGLQQDMQAIQFSVENVRPENPAKEGQTSQECLGTLVVAIPPDIIMAAHKQSAVNKWSFNLPAEAALNQFSRKDNLFSRTVQYSTDLTHDATKINLQLKDSPRMGPLLQNLLLAKNLTAPVSKMAASEVMELPDLPDEALTAASDSMQPDSNLPDNPNTGPVDGDQLAQMQNDNNQAQAEIERIWQELPEEVRQSLRAEEQAWKSKRISSCRASAQAATNPTEREYKRLQCDTDSIRARIGELSKYHVSE